MRRDWAGPCAFVLALAIGVGLAAALIIIAVKPEPLDQQFEAVLSTLAGAAVGAVGTYLGTTSRQRTPDESQTAHTDTEPEGKERDGQQGGF